MLKKVEMPPDVFYTTLPYSGALVLFWIFPVASSFGVHGAVGSRPARIKMRTNLIIPSSQISGNVISPDEMNHHVRRLNAVNGFHFSWLKEFSEKTGFEEGQKSRMFGTIFNLSFTHHFVNYFGTKAVPCSVDLLNEAAKDYARRYYCHAENYVHMELDGNIFDGKSLPRGPAMCYLVKFMEEIIGFKTVPGKLFSIDPQGKPLPKAFHKSYPPVGFDNNFQPEAYAAAENKIAYMRNLTIVQKILAVQWMAMGEHAFREDLEPLYTAKERDAILKKERKAALKKEKLVLKKQQLEERDKATYDKLFKDHFGHPPIHIPGDLGRMMSPQPQDRAKKVTKLDKTSRYDRNSVSQRDFRRLPLAERIDLLFEMAGGSCCGRTNRKLSTRKTTTRADFLAASLCQQTLYLYRKFNQLDDDENQSFLKKHLGSYYTRNGKPVTALNSINRGRVTDQTRFLAKFAGKLEKQVNKNKRDIASLQAKVRRINSKGMLDGVKNIGNAVTGVIGGVLGGVVGGIAGIGTSYLDPSKWMGIAGGSAGLAGLAMATAALAVATTTNTNLSKLDGTLSGHFINLNEWLTSRLMPRLVAIEENQEDLMVFRNRVEMLMITVVQFFERNNISFTDMEGGLIDMTAIRAELEGAYNYLRELISSQEAEMKIANRLLSLRNDELARELEEERTVSAAARTELERRVNSQDALIQNLSTRLEALERAGNQNGSSNAEIIQNLNTRVEALETQKVQQDAMIADLTERLEMMEAGNTNVLVQHLESELNAVKRQAELNDARVMELANIQNTMINQFNDRKDYVDEGFRRYGQWIETNERAIQNLQQTVQSTENRVTEMSTSVTALRDSVVALERTTSDLRVGQQAATSERGQLRDMATRQMNLINVLRGSVNGINSDISSINGGIGRLQSVCNAMKGQYVLKSWSPNQTTNGYGFMRLSMSSFPSDMVSKSNDYIVSIVPFDLRTTDEHGCICSWCDYNGDSGVNVRLSWENTAPLNGGRSVKVWYWAKNPAADYSV